MADMTELNQFNELSKLASISNMSTLDPNQLSNINELNHPGKKDGEIKIVNIPNRGAIVYKWEHNNQKWIEFGEALGKSNPNIYNGKEYDFVHDVEISDNRKAKIAWNRDDDPIDIATTFCQLHNLSLDYKDQIINYISPMCDKELRIKKLQQDKQIQSLLTFKHIPNWQSGSYHLFSSMKINLIYNKIISNNQYIINKDDQLTINEITLLKNLMNEISNMKVSTINSSLFKDNKDYIPILFKLLNWSIDYIIPIIDLYRIILLNSNIFNQLKKSSSIIINHINSIILKIINDNNKTINHMIIINQYLCNYIAKRPKTSLEKLKKSGNISLELEVYIKEILIANYQYISNPNHIFKSQYYTSYTMLQYNIIIWFGRIQIIQHDIYNIILKNLMYLISSNILLKDKVIFYTLLTIGSITYISSTSKQFLFLIIIHNH